MPTIAAAIITFNEEKNIERCILGLIDCVDEIVVLDSFSTDRTQEICSRYPIRFIQKKWEGYAQTKNNLNEIIQKDYIFSIDADEVPDDTLKAEISAIRASHFSGIYIINRKTNYCGQWIKHCGWYPEYKARIFPKNEARWEGDFVHEQLNYPSSLEVKQLKGHLEHYSYYSIEEHQLRAEKYAKLSAKKSFSEGAKAFFLKPILSAIAKYMTILVFKKGFLDGYLGFKIAWISAKSTRIKYKELIRLNKNNEAI